MENKITKTRQQRTKKRKENKTKEKNNKIKERKENRKRDEIICYPLAPSLFNLSRV